MSFSKFSILAVLSATAVLSACAKNESSSAPAAAAGEAPVISAEVKQAIEDTSCPEINGTFQRAFSNEAEFLATMSSVKGGVAYNSTPKDGVVSTLVADGQSHEELRGAESVSYIASCKDGVLQIVTKTSKGTSTVTREVNAGGNVLETETQEDGQAHVSLIKKVTPVVVPEAAPAEATTTATPDDEQHMEGASYMRSSGGGSHSTMTEGGLVLPEETATTPAAPATQPAATTTTEEKYLGNPVDQPAQIGGKDDGNAGTPPPMPAEPSVKYTAPQSNPSKPARDMYETDAPHNQSGYKSRH